MVVKDTEILAFLNPLVSIAAQYEQGTGATVGGRTIVKAGTLIGGGFTESYNGVAEIDTDAPEGINLYDVDTTDGDAEGAVVLLGFINTDVVESTIAATYTEEVKAALPKIGFIANGKGGTQ